VVRRTRLMRRSTFRELCRLAGVALAIGLLVSITGIGLTRSLLLVALPSLLLGGAMWTWHRRRLRAVRREATAGILSIESWLERQGRGRRS